MGHKLYYKKIFISINLIIFFLIIVGCRTPEIDLEIEELSDSFVNGELKFTVSISEKKGDCDAENVEFYYYVHMSDNSNKAPGEYLPGFYTLGKISKGSTRQKTIQFYPPDNYTPTSSDPILIGQIYGDVADCKFLF